MTSGLQDQRSNHLSYKGAVYNIKKYLNSYFICFKILLNLTPKKQENNMIKSLTIVFFI